MSFVDESCIIFDTDDENKFEYTAIHEVREIKAGDPTLSLVLQEADRRVAL